MEEKRIDEEQKELEIIVDGLTEKEAVEVMDILKRFIKAYQDSGEEQETFEWLEKQLKEELSDKTEKEIYAIKEEIVESIQEYDADIKDLTMEAEKGKTKERWFADRIGNAAKGVAVNAYGNYLNYINSELEYINCQTERMIMSAPNHINLDGFIAERHHVDSFNAKAVLHNSPLRATSRWWIEGPKGSHDIMIWNPNTYEVLEEYQVAYGKTPQITKNILRRDLMEGREYQTCLVPKGQVELVQEGIPEAKITDYIGGTDKVNISSSSLSVEDAREMQRKVQQENTIPRTDWNIYNTRELALGLGKYAGQVGIMTAVVTTGFDLAGRVINGEEMDSDEIVETALKAGVDAGVKAAVGGALTVVSERRILSILPLGTLPRTLAQIACVGVENVKILWKTAKGELTMSEALEQMGRTSTAMTAGLYCAGIGTLEGAAIFGFIPIIGPIIGGLVGGMIGYMAGNGIGEAIFNGAKKVAERGKEIVKKTYEGVKKFGNRIPSGINRTKIIRN